MSAKIWSIPRITFLAVDRPAADTAAVVTIPAQERMRHMIREVIWSYDGAPSGGRLTITGLQGGVTFDIAIKAAGPAPLPMEAVGAVNTDLVVTLAAGGGTVVGKLNVLYTTGKTAFWWT